MAGIPAFDEAVEPLSKRFEGEQAATEIKAGELFRKICQREYTAANMKRLIEMYPDSVYATVAKRCIEEEMPGGYKPLLYFYDRDKNINEWAYLHNIVGQ